MATTREIQALRLKLERQQDQQFNELKKLIQSQQRSTARPITESHRPQHGAWLTEALHPSHWAELADRSRPLPQGLNPEFGLKMMSAFLSAEISERVERSGGY